ncbi:dihydrofolate synthase / folylpolyglutamate synthase [Georgenia satyanarayanai]|uniref:Dihydrofolate synthase/folylpolyglutamate synthase n=1 Tax=Georgenia satyanarayanai TaxID=860221 RepID=A0A2Y9AHV1_9MICO|nr:folylpolyglutamate synthase/dihydrofolate synthase family protein [Georgenia satyanarayanai]PYF99943.1 dihydrofolate synthase/folylpolyglutamate synthase [Georgenia satyanarayanai]SSA41947.1 dihydrofolate synthase / folylpolyglutamate synthase [Georgenia satyanarayanai]
MTDRDDQRPEDRTDRARREMLSRRTDEHAAPPASGGPTPASAETPDSAELEAREVQAEHDRAAQELVASGLFSGPDPTVIDDVRASSDPTVVVDPVARAQAETEVHRIYTEILTRAPEHDVQPSLDRVREVLDLLGEPQRAYPVIHIAGTNGKTSTARVVERLLRERGLRTGRFTSPHLSTVRERIALDGEPISPEAFVRTWEDVAPYVEMVDERSRAAGGPRLSFFEVFVVMGYAAFADAPVDVAVVETGMGGRWDATNVADGTVEILTSISRDHEQWLGDTLEAIAGEKVGILTPGSTVVSAEQHDEVTPVVRDAAHALGARLVVDGQDMEVVDRQLAVGGQMLVLRTPAATYTDVFLPLHGAHQARNALLAVAAVEAFFGGGSLSGEVVEHALASVDSPGRLELVRTSPTVLVDAAHNPAGVEVLREALEESFDLRRVVGVVGLMADKDAEGILSGLEPMLTEIVITRAATDRAHDVEDLAELARDIFDEDRVHVTERIDEAIDLAAARAEYGGEPGGAVLVTGSVVLVGEARLLLRRG